MNITNDIKYIGVNDHQIDLFEGQYAVPNGMAYNSYAVLDEKIAVMDTVDRNFTHNADIFPFMKEFINHLTERGLKNKTVALIENGSWAPQAVKAMKAMLDSCKNITYTEIRTVCSSAQLPKLV